MVQASAHLVPPHPAASRLAGAPASFVLGGVAVPLRVRESARARGLALRIDAARSGVELVLPRRVSLAAGLRFLEARGDWVAARLAVLPARIPFAPGAVVPILGVAHRICHLGMRRGGAARVVEIAEGEIRVHAAPDHLARRVRDHLVEVARGELARRARAQAERVGRRVARVTVRDMTSRWGSCTATGSLAFCWRLILAPEPVLDYVVAHEVAHLVEMNHGPRFWRLVETLMPGSAGQRRWLSRNRDALMRFG